MPVPAEAKEARRGRRGTRHCLLTVPSGPQQSHFSGFKIALWSEACDHAWVDSQEFVGIHTVYVRLFVVRFLKTHSFFLRFFASDFSCRFFMLQIFSSDFSLRFFSQIFSQIFLQIFPQIFSSDFSLRFFLRFFGTDFFFRFF